MLSPRFACALSIAIAVGCDTDEIRRVSSTGYFNPPEIDFGIRTVGRSHELTTSLTNTSASELRVIDVQFDPPENAYAARLPDGSPLRGALLARGARTVVTIVYAPQEARPYDTSMVLVFNDFQIELPIVAGAEVIPPAAPVLSPSSLVFGEIEVGREVVEVVTVSNGGQTGGTLKAIKGASAPFSVTAVGGGPLQLPSAVLDPGDSLYLEVHYRPVTASHAEGALEISFDSGEVANLALSGDSIIAGTLTCSGPIEFGAVPRGTVAVESIDCTISGGPYALAELRFSSGSSRLFSVIAPPSGQLAAAFTFEVRFDAEGLAAHHTASIELVAAHGIVTRVNLGATVDPPLPGTTDLRAVLEWNTPWSDFDLHLSREGGALFSPEDDCFYGSKNPDWGQANDQSDDPFLDRDDVDGYGPEEVSLSRVADSPRIYRLYVQYHHYSRDSAPPTIVTVTYQLQDQPPQTIERELSTCGNLWYVGRLLFDDATPEFQPVDTENADYMSEAGERCR